MDTLHKFLLKMLHQKDKKDKQNNNDKKPKENSDVRYVTDMESSLPYSSKR